MKPVLFDEERRWKDLLPLTFTRPVSEIRIGILTIREKWEKALDEACGWMALDYLSEKFPSPKGKSFLHINSGFCPSPPLVKAILKLKKGQALMGAGEVIAYAGETGQHRHSSVVKIPFGGETLSVNRPVDIFLKNAQAIRADFEAITRNRMSLPFSRSVTVIGKKAHVFMEVGARAEACIFNTTNGPIYLDKHSEVMEGSAIRGPFALGEHSQLKLNSKVYGATTVGPHCKVGGEVSNSVIFGYSNKAHDGFLGNSVLGEWCNLGADTNNSNLKNNYGNVKLYSYASGRQEDTGLQFCGMIMGDHSKTGINTMLNTGTVIGVGCNIFGGGFPPATIPDFSWGGAGGFEDHSLDKFLETAARVYERRQLRFSETEKRLLSEVYRRSR
jgi:UDP-N-acetylglucosamine diphosphorylase/glucosamine-1-phosphate N-acetyltransferase